MDSCQEVVLPVANVIQTVLLAFIAAKFQRYPSGPNLETLAQAQAQHDQTRLEGHDSGHHQ